MPSVGHRVRAAFVAALTLFAAACSSSTGESAPSVRADSGSASVLSSTTLVTLPLADEALDDPEVTTVASDLAPSQVVASTVPEPPTPGPCALDDVEMWTANVEVTELSDGFSSRTAIRIRNRSDVWCEPDIGRSPRLDPLIEPDVWLQPGDEAELWVGDRQTDCAAPEFQPAVQVAIGDEPALVPTAVLACQWWLDAFLPLDEPTSACEPGDLDLRATDSAVIVQVETASCRLAEIVAPGEPTTDPGESSTPVVNVLRPGDVAMLASVADESCDDPERSIVVDVGAEQRTIDEVPCGLQWFDGGARPWYGSDAGPWPVTIDGAIDLDATLQRLQPFA